MNQSKSNQHNLKSFQDSAKKNMNELKETTLQIIESIKNNKSIDRKLIDKGIKDIEKFRDDQTKKLNKLISTKESEFEKYGKIKDEEVEKAYRKMKILDNTVSRLKTSVKNLPKVGRPSDFLPSNTNKYITDVKNKLKNKLKVSIIYYGKSGCPACIKFEPTWEKLKDIFKKAGAPIVMHKIDCAESQQKCVTARITSVPTLVIYIGDYEYNYIGGMELNEIVNYINDKIKT